MALCLLGALFIWAGRASRLFSSFEISTRAWETPIWFVRNRIEYDIVIEDSDTFVRRTVLKEKIQKIYEDSHQNYGAPKITAELRKSGECISEKTVGNYMRQMGIKAQ